MARAMLKIIVWRARNAGSENSNSSIMLVRSAQTDQRSATNAFTLIEVLMALVILALVMAGLMYGYVQANRIAEWTSMSLAAQSSASQGLEQARGCQWNSLAWPPTNGPGTGDECPPTTNYTIVYVDTLDVPSTGSTLPVTNYVLITDVGSANHPLRQISSAAYWTFSLTGTTYSNVVVTQRAPDQ
jgi:prepilin-type N-terminal cleavage/methylation domain-containing protein